MAEQEQRGSGAKGFVVVEENPGFNSAKPTAAVDGNRRRTAHREGSCRPLGGVRSAVMAKKYGDVREALIDAGWQAVRQRGSHEIWAS
jgi:hypothetical protein